MADPSPELEDFKRAVRRAKKAAYRDSNDGEIYAYQDAVEAACSLLGLMEWARETQDEVNDWAEEKGLA